jgi:hypothetical protein
VRAWEDTGSFKTFYQISLQNDATRRTLSGFTYPSRRLQYFLFHHLVRRILKPCSYFNHKFKAIAQIIANFSWVSFRVGWALKCCVHVNNSNWEGRPMLQHGPGTDCGLSCHHLCLPPEVWMLWFLDQEIKVVGFFSHLFFRWFTYSSLKGFKVHSCELKRKQKADQGWVCILHPGRWARIRELVLYLIFKINFIDQC